MEILNKISSPRDLRELSKTELLQLCGEIREFLIENISETGGHLASNLGVVELTVAIHKVFDTERDRLVFDVGHQCYVHKMLTGRLKDFSTLRQTNGLAGFPKPSESVHDSFIAGHASNSISVALGMARARTMRKQNYDVIALTGDGALTGGLAYEALNDAGVSNEPLIIILNDNGMAITPNMGGIAHHLSMLRMKPGYIELKNNYKKFLQRVPGGQHIYKWTSGIKNAIKDSILPCSMFEDMGFEYFGPVDGHDIEKLTEVLTWAKERKCPAIVHVITVKGKGYKFSERHPDEYHGVSKFDFKTGLNFNGERDFSAVFGKKLEQLVEQDEKIIAITAAMRNGTGLERFSRLYPDRFFDVGIAEGHAVSMASGAAKQGLTPVFAVYSTFLQRAVDMVIHDAAILSNHVVFGVDRAGIVGGDGETHQDVFDVAFWSSVPGMKIFCPASFAELEDMLERAVCHETGPVAVRYPRGGEGRYKAGGSDAARRVTEGTDFTIVTYGTLINETLNAYDILKNRGISVEVIKLGVINPLDADIIKDSVLKTKRLMVVEECVSAGCIGERIAAVLLKERLDIKCLLLKNLGERFVQHGAPKDIKNLYGIDADGISDAVIKELEK